MAVLLKDTTKNRKQRLVFGIFGNQVPLLRALGDLALKGFAREELCILGTRDVLKAAANFTDNRAQKHTQHMALLSDVVLYPPTMDIETLVGSRGPMLGLLVQGFTSAPKSEKEQPSAYCEETTAKLIEYIKDGCMVLVVAIKKPRQLSHASKIMLRRSAHDVQTNEWLL